MLRLEPTRGKRAWFLSDADAYTIFDNEEEIGRIDLIGQGEDQGDALIVMRGQAFEGRIHVTGKGQWAHVPSRWVLHAAERELHVATWESARTWLTQPELGLEAMRLQRAMFNPTITVTRASNSERVAEIRWLRPQVVPTTAGQRLAIDFAVALPETVQLFLLWIVVMDNYRNKS